MNDNQQIIDEAKRLWDESYILACQETLEHLKMSGRLLRSQTLRRDGVAHIRKNWNQYHDALDEIAEIIGSVTPFCKETEQENA